MAPRLRIFLSSPGDVNQERLRAHLIIQKLARDYARYFTIEPFLWEYEPMLASKHFQDAIDPPSSFDIVLLIVWSRLGTPLPEKTSVREYRGIDNRVPVTGTEWEFEDALQGIRSRGGKGPPDLLAYRRLGDVVASLENSAELKEKIKQYEALLSFWNRWFKSDNQFLAGYAEYHTLQEFDRRLESDLSKLIERRIKERSIDQPTPIWLKGSPFRGLEAFDFDDAPIFFGRDGNTREGITRLAEAAEAGTAFLLVSGASGSGKSSLARAGLLPSLVATKAIANVGIWRRVVMRPGDAGGNPVAAFTRALLSGDPAKGEGLVELAGKQVSPEELEAHFRTGGSPGLLFIKTLRDLAETERTKLALLPHEQARLVLLVDQLEELFTRPEINEDDKRLFAQLLATLACSGVVWVIATMRSDFWHRIDSIKELHDLTENGARLALAAPDAAQLLEMIRQPAQAAGLTFETDPDSGLALDALLAKEAAEEPGVLPLLSVILDDLYRCDVQEGHTGGLLTAASYYTLGGLRTAIGKRAERILQKLREQDSEAAEALPALLRALVTVDPYDRTLGARSALLAKFEPGSPGARLIEIMSAADARLLTAEDRGHGPEVRLSHEALIENWVRAKTIITESTSFIRIRDHIETQCRRWESAGRRKEFLLSRGLPLAEAEDITNKFEKEIPPEVRAFVRSSRKRANRAQMVGWALAGLFAMISAGAVWQWRAATNATERAQAEESTARQERARAEEQRNRAESSLRVATETANVLVSDLARKFRDKPGMPIDLVRDILDRAQRLQDQLIGSGEISPELRFSAAKALNELVLTLLEQGDAKVNANIEAVLKLAQRFQTIMTELVVSNAQRTDWQYELSLSQNRLGDALIIANRGQLALENFTKGLEIRERLATAEPNNIDWQESIATSYTKIGDALLKLGAGVKALDAYDESLSIRQRIAGLDQDNPQRQRETAVSYERKGLALQFLDQFEEALETFTASLEIRQKLVEGQKSIQWSRDLSVSYERVGDVLVKIGKNEDALRAFRASLAIRQNLASVDPANKQRERDVAVIFGRIGDTMIILGEREAGLEALRSNLAIREKLARDDPDNVLWQTDLVIALRRLALVGENPQLYLTRALEIARRLEADGKLGAEQAGWIEALEQELTILPK
jgi:tetratricopeptide (TPR) repeat protein